MRFNGVNKTYFNVIAKLPKSKYNQHTFDTLTYHILQRKSRVRTYYERVGLKKIVDVFLVDKGHRNGLEIHLLRANRVIEIYNKNTSAFITVLYARPEQIQRYYYKRGSTPHHLFDPFIKGLNNI